MGRGRDELGRMLVLRLRCRPRLKEVRGSALGARARGLRKPNWCFRQKNRWQLHKPCRQRSTSASLLAACPLRRHPSSPPGNPLRNPYAGRGKGGGEEGEMSFTATCFFSACAVVRAFLRKSLVPSSELREDSRVPRKTEFVPKEKNRCHLYTAGRQRSTSSAPRLPCPLRR